MVLTGNLCRPGCTSPVKAAVPRRSEVTVAARDGVGLATDVYRPAVAHPVPTVLIRTPYGKLDHLQDGLGWARHGFACVVQDVRGRHESEGVWHPYLQERCDGADTVAWLASQPWSDGRVVTCGASYAAFTAWAGAVVAPENVYAVISAVPAMGLRDVKLEPAGMLRLAEHVLWWVRYAECRTARPRLSKAMLSAEPDLMHHLPLADIGSRVWANVPGWLEVLEPGCDAEAVTDHELAGLVVPTLHLGGWYDLLLLSTLHHWQVAGRDVVPRAPRALVIGPWPHQLTASGTALGDRRFGASSRLHLGTLQAQWAGWALGYEAAAEPSPVRVFVVGENRWVTPPDWPPPDREELVLYAAPEARLEPRPCSPRGSEGFSYDPAEPFPSLPTLADRADLDRRGDVVRFTSGPLAEDIVIAGTPAVVLHVSTDCPSTDFVVHLDEVTPDGQVLPIARGCTVVNDAASASSSTGDGVRCEFPMTPTATAVSCGHRLRIEVTSSDFPDLARNLNTGHSAIAASSRSTPRRSRSTRAASTPARASHSRPSIGSCPCGGHPWSTSRPVPRCWLRPRSCI